MMHDELKILLPLVTDNLKDEFNYKLTLLDAFTSPTPEQVLFTLEKSTEPEDLLDIAEAYAYAGKIDKANQNIQKAIKIARTQDANELCITLSRAAIICGMTGTSGNHLLSEALKHATKDLELNGSKCDCGECFKKTIHSLASNCADHIALGFNDTTETLFAALKLMRQSGSDTDDSVIGLIARKLALKNEIEPTNSQALDTAITVYKSINDRNERFFTSLQIGVAVSKLQIVESAIPWMTRELPYKDEVAPYHLAMCIRAASQADITQLPVEENARAILEAVWKDYLNALEKKSKNMEFIGFELESVLTNYLLAGAHAKKPVFFNMVEPLISIMPIAKTAWRFELELAEHEADLGQSAVEASIARLSRLLEETDNNPKFKFDLETKKELLYKFTMANSRLYSTFGDVRFLNLLQNALHSKLASSISKMERSYLLLEAIRIIHSMKIDDKYGVRFFRF